MKITNCKIQITNKVQWAKYEIPKLKTQITNKLQWPMNQIPNLDRLNDVCRAYFGHWVFEYWILFGICYLGFGI